MLTCIKIKAFLQGAVYSWCITCKDQWFCVRDFIGGDNYYWEHYPLGVLYSRHIDAGHDHDYAFDQAAKDRRQNPEECTKRR